MLLVPREAPLASLAESGVARLAEVSSASSGGAPHVTPPSSRSCSGSFSCAGAPGCGATSMPAGMTVCDVAACAPCSTSDSLAWRPAPSCPPRRDFSRDSSSATSGPAEPSACARQRVRTGLCCVVSGRAPSTWALGGLARPASRAAFRDRISSRSGSDILATPQAARVQAGTCTDAQTCTESAHTNACVPSPTWAAGNTSAPGVQVCGLFRRGADTQCAPTGGRPDLVDHPPAKHTQFVCANSQGLPPAGKLHVCTRRPEARS